ncbi:glycosyltransferase family 1 protein [Pseudokordiimonas caeni]|uniref:glycosyltransferase family 1 protein n=1 Tax=Pseudokordiimonas caeni TaxID=2997908 RepID=UPI0028121314|nr:glycosyltransferase family 1 protein [Pseudokordiimonas caeni]
MSRSVTVFVDCHTFDAGWQGTTTYLAGILNALPGAMAAKMPDIKLRLVCAAESADNIHRFLTVPFEFAPIRTGFLWRNAVDIPRALRRTGADVVLSQYIRPFAAPCPTISVIHDVLFLDFPNSFSWSYRTLRRLLFGWSARHSTRVSTVSRYSAGRIEHHFGVSADTIAVIANAVDPVFLQTPRVVEADAGPLRLLSVSRLERRKRHEWGIQAQQMLTDTGIDSEYTIIGSGVGEYAAQLHAEVAQARSVGLKVDIRAGLSSADLAAVYASSDLLLFPSEAEGFGIPVIEAAAAGLPAIISDGGALADFRSKFAGHTFPADDNQAFLAAVHSASENIKTLRAEAAAKRARIGTDYSWDEAAGAYADMILWLTGGKP